MKLKKLIIENFRNYKEADIDLSNKNVVFGANDVGKTNLLYSLRFLLDRKVRFNGFSESDYYQRDTNKTIEITLKVDLENRDRNSDSQHIISKVKGARQNTDLDCFYFQVRGKYEESEAHGEPMLYWGNNLENLVEVPSSTFISEIDKLFNIVYIDASVDLDQVFSKNKKQLFNEKHLSEDDIKIKEKIDKLTEEMNKEISDMEMIINFQNELTSEYHQLKKEEINIELQSEMAIKGFFSDIYPYIRKEGEDNLYPTSGDGRKKILAYSLINYVTNNYHSDRITIYLIEEPENNLHPSMQIALSKQLFNQDIYEYFMLSTHSSELLYEMDEATLIRIYSKDKTDCESYTYQVPKEFTKIKKELNQDLTRALFSDRVLLVEGYSEKVLFEKILSVLEPTYELDGGYLLVVDGIKFEPYFKTLKGLNILPIIKTDNDLKAKRGNKTQFDLIGLNRCLKLLGRERKKSVTIDYSTQSAEGMVIYDEEIKEKMINLEKNKIYTQNQEVIDELNRKNIFISKIDLENDLYEAIPNKMEEVFGDEPIKELQKSKLLNMIKLIENLDKEDFSEIFNHENFNVLHKLVKN